MDNTEIVDITDPNVRLAIWNKATTVEGFDETKYRKDPAGAFIEWDKYGDHHSIYGWDIDHVYPKAKGGTDMFGNLRAMNWQNNESKGIDYPNYTAVVTSESNGNVNEEVNKTVNLHTQEFIKQAYNI